MRKYDNVGRVRRGILRQLQIEYDMLPFGAQRRVDDALYRTRKIVERLDSGVQKRRPVGRSSTKRLFVGGATSITAYIDRSTRPAKRSKVVGKK